MSFNIWTQCAGASRLAAFSLSAWRIVEGQYQVSTRKLVDSLEEQAVLEGLIESSKPQRAVGADLHVLLSTPFRYPPLRHGSRFASRHEPSLWYGSETRRAAFAELAYYRLAFMEGSDAPFESLRTWHTAFTAKARATRGIDLTGAPFDAYKATIASPTDYGPTQALGSAMREAGVDGFRFPSARDREGSVNVAFFTPKVFGRAQPQGFETWHCTASRQRIECVHQDFFETTALVFPREDFLVGGELPAPAL